MQEKSFVEATDLFGRLVGATNFVLDHWWALALLAGLVWLGLRLRSLHELIGSLDERADAAFGDVDALLMERQALVANLVKVVRGFAQHEKDLIGSVLDGRVKALEALGEKVSLHADAQFAASLNNLFQVVDKFPEIAAESHYASLRGDLIRIEERITAARKFYNLAVEESNAVCRSFPANLISHGMPVRQKFSLGDKRDGFVVPAEVEL
jgi:LemA protein